MSTGGGQAKLDRLKKEEARSKVAASADLTRALVTRTLSFEQKRSVEQLIIDPVCTKRGDECWHQVSVRLRGRETNRVVDLGMQDGIRIMELFRLNHIRTEQREHFNTYVHQVGDQNKPRQKYKRKKPSAAPTSLDATAAKPERVAAPPPPPPQPPLIPHPPIPPMPTPPTPLLKKVASKPRTPAHIRAGDVGGVRKIDAVNKKRRKDFNAPKDHGGYGFMPQNFVEKSSMYPGLPLELIKELLRGRYEPKKFPAVTVELVDPLCAISYSESGAGSAAGAKGRATAAHGMSQFAYFMTLLFDVPYTLHNTGPVNIACSMKFPLEKYGKMFDLDLFWADHILLFQTVVYDPENFKGLKWHPPESNLVVSLFKGGAVNIVGLQSNADIARAKRDIIPYLRNNLGRYVINDPKSAIPKEKEISASALAAVLATAELDIDDQELREALAQQDRDLEDEPSGGAAAAADSQLL